MSEHKYLNVNSVCEVRLLANINCKGCIHEDKCTEFKKSEHHRLVTEKSNKIKR